MANLIAANPQFAIQALKEGDSSFIDVTDQSTNQRYRSEFSGNGSVSVLDLVIDNSSNEFAYLTTKEIDTYKEFKDIYSIYRLNIITGQKTLLLSEKLQNYSKSSPFHQLTTDIYNNVYVIKADSTGKKYLYNITYKNGKFIAKSDDFTRSLSTFQASDFNLDNDELKTLPAKTYQIDSIYPSNDGSYYLLGTTDGIKNPRLFVYNGNIGSDSKVAEQQKGFKNLSFVPITTGNEEVRNVVALSLTNALFQTKSSSGRSYDWKSYQSGSGPITSLKNLQVPVSTTSIFSLNTVGDEKNFLDGVDRIAALPNGTLFKSELGGRIQSYNILSILPPNPSATQDQIASVSSLVSSSTGFSIDIVQTSTNAYASVESGNSTTDIYLGAIETLKGFDINIDSKERLFTIYILLNDDYNNIALLREIVLTSDEVSGKSYALGDTTFTLDLGGDGLLSANDSDNVAVANPIADRISINKIDSTTFEIIDDSASFKGLVLQSDDNLLQEANYASFLSATPFSSQSYYSTGYDSSSFKKSGPQRKLSAENEAFNAGYEIGTPLPGINFPTKTDSFEADGRRGKKVKDKLTKKWGEGDKEKEGKFEFELKGGPTNLGYQVDIKNPNKAWQWSQTEKVEAGVKAKIKFGSPKMSSNTVKSQYKKPTWDEAKKNLDDQVNTINNNKSQFTEKYQKELSNNQTWLNILDTRAKKGLVDKNALNDQKNKVNSQMKVAQEKFEKTNAKAAQDIKDAEQKYLKAVGAEQPTLELSANISGAWTLASANIFGPGDLQKFKLSAGAGIGTKIPIRNLGSVAALYFILTVQANFVWERKFTDYKKVGSNDERDQLFGIIDSDIVEAITDQGINIASLSQQQQRKLSNEQIFWRFKKDPLDYIPPSLLSAISTAQSVMEAAGLVMSYIPPVLFVTLLTQLTDSGSKASINQELPDDDILSSVLNFASAEEYQSLRGAPNKNSENYYLSLLREGAPPESDLMKSLQGTQDSFGYSIKAKELGLNANFNFQVIDIDVKGYIGSEFSHDITNQKLSFNAGIGVEAKFKFLFFSVPLSFYYTFYKYEKSPSKVANAGFYNSTRLSLKYQNLMAAENFSPQISLQLNPPTNSIQASSQDLEFLDIYTYDDNNPKSIGLYAIPVSIGSSKTGQLADLYTISGFGNGSTVSWDQATKNFVGRGLYTNAKIKGQSTWKLSPGDNWNFRYPIVVADGISETSPQFDDAIKATSQVSGANYTFLVETSGRPKESGSIMPAENYAAAQYSLETIYYRSSKNSGDGSTLNQISSMPQYEYNAGGIVYAQLDRSMLATNVTFGKDSQSTLILQYKPEAKNRFGSSLSTFYNNDLSNTFLSATLNSNLEALEPITINIVDPSLIPLRGIVDLDNPTYSGYAFSTNSGLSALEGAFRSVQTSASSSAERSTSGQLSTTQLVSFVDKDSGLYNSMIQVSSTRFGFINNQFTGQESQQNSFLTSASIDFKDDSNEYYSGSVAFNQSSLRPTALVGGTGFGNLIDFTGYRGSNVPFIALNQDQSSTPIVRTQFTYEGFEFVLWIQLSIDPFNFSWDSITTENVSGVVIASNASKLPSGFNPNLSDRVLATSSLTALNFSEDGAKVSFAVDARTLNPSTTVTNVNVENAQANLAENAPLNILTFRFNSIDQPLTTGFVPNFSSDVSQQEESDWIYAATDDSDGNSLLYLITDTSIIQSVALNKKQTLWLDPYDKTPKSDLSFVNGKTGLAFSQGSTINTFTSDAGDQYLLIGDPYYRSTTNSINYDGRVFMIKYDRKLLDYAKNSASSKSKTGIPLVSPEEYLKKYPSAGSIIYGKPGENGLFGTSIAVNPGVSGNNIFTISSPGTFDSAAVNNLINNYASSSIFYGDKNTNSPYPISEQLTQPGQLINSSLLYDNGNPSIANNQQSLVYTVGASSSPGSQVLNEDIFSFPIYNMGNEKNQISKKFDGVIAHMDIDKQYGRIDNPSINMVVTNTANSRNYPMTTGRKPGPGDQSNDWSPLAVNWKAVDTAVRQSPAYTLPNQPYDDDLDPDILISIDDTTLMEGENLPFLITHNASQQRNYRIVLEDITGYAGKDYEPLDITVTFDGVESKDFHIAAHDHSEFIGHRLLRIAVYRAEDELRNNLVAYQNVQIKSNDQLKLSTIGTGAAVKGGSTNQSAALAATGLGDGWALMFNVDVDKQGLPISSTASVLKRSNENYSINSDGKYIKNFKLENGFTPISATLTPNSRTILYSMYDSSKYRQNLYALSGWSSPEDLFSKGAQFFNENAVQITPEGISPTFASSILPFTHNGTGYVAVSDPSFGKLYLIRQEAIQSKNAGDSISIDKLASEDGNFVLSAGTDVSIAFASSLAAGSINGRASLVVGAPYSNPNQQSLTPVYGGSVFIVDLDGLLQNKRGSFDLDPKENTKVPTLRIDGSTSVNLDANSQDYQTGFGPSIGSALEFARVSSSTAQLLIGASKYMTGDLGTGAVHVINTNSIPISSKLNKTTVVPFNSLAFAYGQQTQDFTGHTFIGSDGDRLGTSILNLNEYTGGYDLDRQVQDRDVVAFSSPSRFDSAGGVYIYIGNNNPPETIATLNPSSPFEHTFQYVGTVSGSDPSFAIPPDTQAGLNTNSIGKFSSPLTQGVPQGKDLAISVRGSSSPAAVLTYGKPYLYPGETISVFDIEAGGFGEPVLGSGLPSSLGDTNLDGIGDYILYPSTLNGRTDKGASLLAKIEFGRSPTTLDEYDSKDWLVAPSSTYRLDRDSTFSMARNADGSAPIAASALSEIAAFNGLATLQRGARINYKNDILTKQQITGSSFGSGNFYSSNTGITSDLGYEFINGNARFYRGNGNSNFATVSAPPSEQFTYITSSSTNVTLSSSADEILLSSINASKKEAKVYAVVFDSASKPVQTLLYSQPLSNNFTSFTDNQISVAAVDSWTFEGSKYLLVGVAATNKMANPSNPSYALEYYVVNTSTKSQQLIYSLAPVTFSGDSFSKHYWLENLAWSASLSSVGDWNGDGLTDISFAMYYPNISDGSNPFFNRILYGNLEITDEKSQSPSRHRLSYSEKSYQDIVPLSKQSPNIIASIGDVDGSGKNTLFASPLPATDELQKKAGISNLVSFKLFPSDVLPQSLNHFLGTQGDDYIAIDKNQKLSKLKGVVNTYQGADVVSVDWEGIVSKDNPANRGTLFASLGSQDDTFVINDSGLLLQSGTSGPFYQFDLFLNGGSGFDTLSLGPNLNGVRQVLDLTLLLSRSSGIEQINFVEPMSIDLKLLNLSQSKFLGTSGSGLYFSANYGSSLTLFNSQSYSNVGYVALSGLNYAHLYDSKTKSSLYIQEGINLQRATKDPIVGDSAQLALQLMASDSLINYSNNLESELSGQSRRNSRHDELVSSLSSDSFISADGYEQFTNLFYPSDTGHFLA